ncbi:MAG: hypothetical protein H6563_09390 [Lewinellaceae bacterium]|nr:hypothetical protein [Lewinellaceae bacterium]
MTIDFNEKQFRTLLKAIYWAEWLKNNDKIEEEFDADGEDIADLEQYIYSHAKEFNCNDLIEPEPADGEYMPTSELEEEAMEAILEFEDYVFWSELAERLAQRDLEELPAGERTPVTEFFQGEELADRYMSEFEKNGLSHLRLIIKE